MSVYVARQPIFDRKKNVVAYELLCRSGPENVFRMTNGAKATRQLINNSLNVIGWDSLLGDKLAFINVTKPMLVKDWLSMLPKQQSVFELVESVRAEPEVVEACERFKKEGFRIALDDFVWNADMQPLWLLADYVKIDFRQTSHEDKSKMARIFVPKGIRLLAEKVETEEDFALASQLGYTLFQGFFFCAPEMVERKDIPGYKLNYLRLMREVNRPDMDYDQLEQVIKQDVSLSVKLMRYINSVAAGVREKIDSIKHALVLLGQQPLKKWASVVAYMDMGDDKPTELVVTSLIRARFCELLGPESGLKGREMDLFMTGMLSTIDALVDRPIGEILSELPLSSDTRNAILEEKGPLAGIYQMSMAYERGDWKKMDELTPIVGAPPDKITETYRKSVEWADIIFKV